MKFFQYQMPIGRLGATEYMRDASAEDLKVLVCLAEHAGLTDSLTVSRETFLCEARVESAVYYFERAGVLVPAEEQVGDVDGNVVTEYARQTPELSEKETAALIRGKGLSDLIAQCEELLNKPALSPTEARKIVSLVEEEGLSPEYVVLVLNDLRSLKNPTVALLCQRAAKYLSDGYKTARDLQEFFLDRDKKAKGIWAVMKVCGIRDRNLTAEENEAFARWTEVYGYGKDVLTLAYDFTVRGTGRFSVPYMDKILTAWHSAGLLTAQDCEKYHMQNRPEEYVPEKKRPGRKKADGGFATFDPDEAFRNALTRSYGDDEKK